MLVKLMSRHSLLTLFMLIYNLVMNRTFNVTFAVFISGDALSIRTSLAWANIRYSSGYSFVVLKMGTRRIIRLDDLFSVV